MSKRRQLPDPGRRKFLKGATLAGAEAQSANSVAPFGVTLTALTRFFPRPVISHSSWIVTFISSE